MGVLNMGSIKNLLLHCQQNDKEYKKHEEAMSWEKYENRLINLGWIQALRFVENNFDSEEKTITKQKGE